jgi:hypothetical protein
MGAVRRTNAGWRQAVKPFSLVGWHHDSKVVATELIKSLRRVVRSFTTNRRQDVVLANAAASLRSQHTHPGASMCIR